METHREVCSLTLDVPATAETPDDCEGEAVIVKEEKPGTQAGVGCGVKRLWVAGRADC